MSWCDGPPGKKTMITDLCRRGAVDAASARSSVERSMPPSASPPTVSNDRLETPPQKAWDFPVMVIMELAGWPSGGATHSNLSMSDILTGWALVETGRLGDEQRNQQLECRYWPGVVGKSRLVFCTTRVVLQELPGLLLSSS